MLYNLENLLFIKKFRIYYNYNITIIDNSLFFLDIALSDYLFFGYKITYLVTSQIDGRINNFENVRYFCSFYKTSFLILKLNLHLLISATEILKILKVSKPLHISSETPTFLRGPYVFQAPSNW